MVTLGVGLGLSGDRAEGGGWHKLIALYDCKPNPTQPNPYICGYKGS